MVLLYLTLNFRKTIKINMFIAKAQNESHHFDIDFRNIKSLLLISVQHECGWSKKSSGFENTKTTSASLKSNLHIS